MRHLKIINLDVVVRRDDAVLRGVLDVLEVFGVVGDALVFLLLCLLRFTAHSSIFWIFC